MKKFIYMTTSLLFFVVTLIFLVTVTIPWMNDPSGGLHSPGLIVLAILAHIGVPGYFLCRAELHEEPYKYRNELKISLSDDDAEKCWRHRL